MGSPTPLFSIHEKNPRKSLEKEPRKALFQNSNTFQRNLKEFAKGEIKKMNKNKID
jgi:hypothetical protein